MGFTQSDFRSVPGRLCSNTSMIRGSSPHTTIVKAADAFVPFSTLSDYHRPMEDIALCNPPLLQTREYMESVTGSFSVIIDRSYRKTYRSSKKNLDYGLVRSVHWRLPLPHIPHVTRPQFHAHESIPARLTRTPITNEAQSVAHCLHHFILPMSQILKSEYPHLHFYVGSEVRLFIVEEEDSDEEDSVPVRKAEARVDIVLRRSREGCCKFDARVN